jgi:hypothetical protein
MNLFDRLRDSAKVPIGTDERSCQICGRTLSFRFNRTFCRYCEAVNVPLVVRAMSAEPERRKRWKRRR